MPRYMNEYLPEDIAVLTVEEAAPRFHARLNAVRKTYIYRIWNAPVGKNVLRRRFTHIDPEPAGFLMPWNRRGNSSAAELTEALGVLFPEEVQEVYRAYHREDARSERWDRRSRISYTGDGFLYHIVRVLTGTLVEVGLGLRKPEEMTEILEGQDRKKAGQAYASRKD